MCGVQHVLAKLKRSKKMAMTAHEMECEEKWTNAFRGTNSGPGAVSAPSHFPSPRRWLVSLSLSSFAFVFESVLWVQSDA